MVVLTKLPFLSISGISYFVLSSAGIYREIGERFKAAIIKYEQILGGGEGREIGAQGGNRVRKGKFKEGVGGGIKFCYKNWTLNSWVCVGKEEMRKFLKIARQDTCYIFLLVIVEI